MPKRRQGSFSPQASACPSMAYSIARAMPVKQPRDSIRLGKNMARHGAWSRYRRLLVLPVAAVMPLLERKCEPEHATGDPSSIIRLSRYAPSCCAGAGGPAWRCQAPICRSYPCCRIHRLSNTPVVFLENWEAWEATVSPAPRCGGFRDVRQLTHGIVSPGPQGFCRALRGNKQVVESANKHTRYCSLSGSKPSVVGAHSDPTARSSRNVANTAS